MLKIPCLQCSEDRQSEEGCAACDGLGFLYWFPGSAPGIRYSATGVAARSELFQAWAAAVWNVGFGDDGTRELTMQRDLPIMALGVGGEAGEVQELVKKHIRDGEMDLEKLKKELGDTLYYLVRIASFYGVTFEQVALSNILKCEGRIKRGTRRGSGDDR